MKEPTKNKTIQLHVVLPEEVHRQFKVFCVERGLEMGVTVQNLIKEAVAHPQKRRTK